MTYSNNRRAFICLFFVFGFSMLLGSSAHAEYPGTRSEWHGFDRYDFQVAERACRVIVPKSARADMPWVWRGRFPDWHPEVDRILLDKGFHIAYMDVANLFGNAEAVGLWDSFYGFAVGELGLAKRVALESTSRGGLIVYNWASRNTEKVTCIYLESPVCTLASWPGGRGTGVGSPDDWTRAQAAYGLPPEQLAEPDQNPISRLGTIVDAGIPILHVFEPSDRIVPPVENTLEVFKRVQALGGKMSVLLNEDGPLTSEGHHFPLDDPNPIVAFILQSYAPDSSTPPPLPFGYDYFSLRNGLDNAHIVFSNQKRGRVAFLGGSITQMNGWRDLVTEDITKRFPDIELDFVQAGVASMGSTPGAFRLKRDVFGRGPVDLLFVEAAVNDSTNYRTSAQQIRGMEGIIRHARELNPKIEIIMMHFVDPEKMQTYNEGLYPEVITNHERVAKHYSVSSLNLAREVTERIRAKEFTWEGDFKDLHPSPFGHEIYRRSIARLLDTAWAEPLKPDATLIDHLLANEPLDPYSYARGTIVDIAAAEELNGFEVAPNWKPSDGTGTRPGFVNAPMLVAMEPGATLRFQFDGTAVGLWVAAGQDAGIVEYRIDGATPRRQDLFTPWSKSLHLPWAYIFDDELSSGPHTLELKVLADKNPDSSGTAVRIAHFLVNRSEE